jgi:hypothetical protein
MKETRSHPRSEQDRGHEYSGLNDYLECDESGDYEKQPAAPTPKQGLTRSPKANILGCCRSSRAIVFRKAKRNPKIRLYSPRFRRNPIAFTLLHNLYYDASRDSMRCRKFRNQAPQIHRGLPPGYRVQLQVGVAAKNFNCYAKI